MKIGKYIVTPKSRQTEHADGFVGSALLLWDEKDCTCEQAFHFHKTLPTAEAAEQHAIEQIQIRVRDGHL